MRIDRSGTKYMDGHSESLASYTPSFTEGPNHWYAPYTYPRHEKAVTKQLESKCIQTFLPLFSTEKRWKDRRVHIQEPAFPGYVFTRINPNDRGRVLATPGIIRMLSFNGTLVPIDDAEMAAVSLCIERGVTLKPYPSL